MTEKDSEKERFAREAYVIKAGWREKEREELKPMFETGKTTQSNSTEALHEKLTSMASESTVSIKTARTRPSQEIFRVQEKIEEKKNTAKKLMMAALAALVAAGIGYPAKLAYDGKIEVKKLSQDYKSLQITIAELNRRNLELYKKIFPQVQELETSKLESALKGIEENIDLAAKMKLEADALWTDKKYDQALELYERASKTNPLNDRSAYLLKEAELTKYDQSHFKHFYIVRKGDTLERLAKRAKVSAQRIQNANGPKYVVLYQGRLIKGMRLALPEDIDLVRKK